MDESMDGDRGGFTGKVIGRNLGGCGQFRLDRSGSGDDNLPIRYVSTHLAHGWEWPSHGRLPALGMGRSEGDMQRANGRRGRDLGVVNTYAVERVHKGMASRMGYNQTYHGYSRTFGDVPEERPGGHCLVDHVSRLSM